MVRNVVYLGIRTLGMLATLVVLLLMSGCFMKLAYDNADRIVVWEVDDYLDLNRDQKQFVRKRINEHLAWHRREALEHYIDFLDLARERVERGLTQEDVDWFIGRIIRFRSELVDVIVADAAQLLTTTSRAQLEHLFREFDDQNAKQIELLQQDHEEKVEHRADAITDFVTRWTGRLAPEQRDKIERLSAEFPDTHARWYAYQRMRQARFERIVIDAQRGADVSAALREWMLMRAPDAVPEFWSSVKSTVLAVDRMLTPRQRDHAVTEISDLADTLRAILEAGANVADDATVNSEA